MSSVVYRSAAAAWISKAARRELFPVGRQNIRRIFLSVAALCKEFHLSRAELYSMFREYFSSSVAGFIKNRRLQKARLLLEQTSLPVWKIARQCGIPDYNYFSKQFKSCFSCSPGDWRTKNRL